MLYQIVFFEGDITILNGILQQMQTEKGCEIIDVIKETNNSFLIKYKTPDTSKNWFQKLIS